MINKENIRKWVEALRSGKYKQGTGALKTVENGMEWHCCLGVACEVAIKNGVNLNTSVESHRVIFDGFFGGLPTKVSIWLGLEKCYDNPLITIQENRQSCVWHNDQYKRTFAEIADGIEKEFLQ